MACKEKAADKMPTDRMIRQLNTIRKTNWVRNSMNRNLEKDPNQNPGDTKTTSIKWRSWKPQWQTRSSWTWSQIWLNIPVTQNKYIKQLPRFSDTIKWTTFTWGNSRRINSAKDTEASISKITQEFPIFRNICIFGYKGPQRFTNTHDQKKILTIIY